VTVYNDIAVEDDGIKLGQFLKLADLVESGAQAKQVLAGGALAQELVLLLLRTVGGDRRAAERDVRLHGDADRRVGAADLLKRQVVRHEISPGAAELLGQREAHQSQAGHLGDDVVGEFLLAV
jgi:hypothetical protein